MANQLPSSFIPDVPLANIPAGNSASLPSSFVPDAPSTNLPAPKPQSGYEKFGNAVGGALFGVEKGIAKGAADTIASVPLNINKVVGGFVGLKTDKQFNEARQKIVDSNNKLLEIRKNLDPTSEHYKNITNAIKSGIQTINDINGKQNEVQAEISGLGEKPGFIVPKTTSEKIGYGGEKVAEFIYAGKKLANPAEASVTGAIKGTALPTLAKKALQVGANSAIEGITAGGVTAAQGGDLKDITRNTVLSSLISVPFKTLEAFQAPAADYLAGSAEKKATQALAPTTRANKELADKVVPELLNRKVTYLTRGGLYQKASEQADTVGGQIGDAFNALPDDAKTTIAPIFQDLENAKSKLFIEGTTKVPSAVAPKYAALQNIQKEILDLASPESQTAVQEINNHIVSAKQAIDSITKGENAAGGKVLGTIKSMVDMFENPQLVDQSKPIADEIPKILDETVTQLKAYGEDGIASKIAAIDPNSISSLEDLRKAMLNEAATPTVLASAKDNIIGSLKKLGMDTSAVESLDPSQFTDIKDFTKAVNEATGNLTSVSSKSLRSFRQILDQVTKESGKGFGFTGTEKAGLLATKSGANSIRDVLASDYPDIAALNKEYTFWQNVRQVVGSTIQRTKGQGTPLGETIAEGTGAIVGSTIKGTIGHATLGATTLALLSKVFRSPAWRNTSAIVRQTLADNIANGNFQKVADMANRILIGATSNTTLPSPQPATGQ